MQVGAGASGSGARAAALHPGAAVGVPCRNGALPGARAAAG